MLRLTLASDERFELERIRDRHPVPYLRERAAAILKVSDGLSCRQVALRGLGRRRRAETVLRWVRGYDADRSVPEHKPRRRSFSP